MAKSSRLLTEAVDYITQFAGQVFVVKFGGEVLLDAKVVDSVCEDLIGLYDVGVRPVVVHGGGHEISNAMKRFGKKPTFVRGLRVTDQETMELVEMVLTGKVNNQIVSRIGALGGEAVGLSGKSGGLFKAKQKSKDLGLVGEITSVNPHLVETQLDNGYIPIVSPVAAGKGGQTLNINADESAAQLAVALKASKLILITNVPGVLDKNKKLVSKLTTAKAKKLAASKAVSGGMIPKINSCTSALKGGVTRAHIIQAKQHALLEEVLTDEGTGTMITKK